MKIDYDKKVDALYVKFKTAPIKKTVLLRDNILLDLDSAKKIVGIEILNAKKQISGSGSVTRELFIAARK